MGEEFKLYNFFHWSLSFQGIISIHPQKTYKLVDFIAFLSRDLTWKLWNGEFYIFLHMLEVLLQKSDLLLFWFTHIQLNNLLKPS